MCWKGLTDVLAEKTRCRLQIGLSLTTSRDGASEVNERRGEVKWMDG